MKFSYKYFLVFVFCLAFISTPIHVSAAANGSNDNFLLYQNPDCNFKMIYPKDWAMQEKVGTAAVMFFSPLEDANDKFRENVNVTVQDLSGQPLSLEQYTEISLNQLKQLMTDIQFFASEKTTLTGYNAYKVIYTFKQGFFNLKIMQIWTIKDNTAYIVTYGGQDTGYDKFTDPAEKMIQSFEITEI